MSSDRAFDVSQTHPPDDGAPWDHLGESGDPAGEPVDPGAWDPVDAPTDDTPPSSMYEVGASDTEPPPAKPERRRWKFLPRSLSSRLVLFVVALVVVVVTAAGSATYLSLKSFLYNRLDQQLTTTATPRRIELLLNANVSPDSFGGPQMVWIAVLDVDGSMFPEQPKSPDIKALPLSARARSSLVDGTTSPRTLTGTNGARVRAVSLASDFNVNGEPVVVVVGLSTSEVDRTLHRLVLIEIAIGAAAVAVALLLTSWGVRLSLRPLNRVTRTAREVTAELSPEGTGLDRRVPVTDAETEVGQLGESFNTLMGTVETQFAARVESEERMRQFLADASHELRTPLTSIRGYAELSRMRRANGETEQSDTLDRIESEGTRMSRLVDDLLLLARSDQGAPPQWESVDVGELVEDAVEGARPAYPQRRIEAVAPPEGLTVLADHDQLLRVLRNLIANAALHTAPEGLIQVRGQREDDDVVLRVVDTGPGLPQEEAQHVFERFWRADKARTRARGGSGLGLAIVASIVQAHGGTVDFDSSVESGSTVTVRLPVSPEVEDAAG